MTAEERIHGALLAAFNRKLMPWESRYDPDVADRLAPLLAAALEEHLAEALQAGWRDSPVSEDRVGVIRRYAEWYGGPTGVPRVPVTSQPWYADVAELCRAIDHLQARVAMMANDSEARADGYALGHAAGMAEGLAKAAAVVPLLDIVSKVIGPGRAP